MACSGASERNAEAEREETGIRRSGVFSGVR